MSVGAGDIKAGEAYVEIGSRIGNAFQRGLRQAEAKLRSWGTNLMRAGVVGAALFTPGVVAAASFETGMANVSTMLDDVGMRHLPALGQGVRRMSVEFGQSTGTLAKGLYDILSASVPAEQSLGVLETSARAAVAGLTDTGVAADAVTTILNAFALSADRAGDVADWFFGIVQKGKTTFPELAASMGRAASTAAIAGVSMEELGALLATMTRAGIKTEEAMTSVNAVISAFLKPADDAVAAAKSLDKAFDLSTATLQAEGLRGVLEKLRDVKPETIAAIFPNIRGFKGAAAALKNYEGFLKDLDAMHQRSGSAGTAFNKIIATSQFQFNQAKQAVVDLAREIGLALLPVLRDLAVSIRDGIAPVRQWIAENHQAIVTSAKIVAALAGLGVAFTALSILIRTSCTGVILAALAGIVEALGVVDLGIVKTMDTVRVAGSKISTWFEAIAIGVEQTWVRAMAAIERSWLEFVGRIRKPLDWLPNWLGNVFGQAGEFGGHGPPAKFGGLDMEAHQAQELARKLRQIDEERDRRLRELAARRQQLFDDDLRERQRQIREEARQRKRQIEAAAGGKKPDVAGAAKGKGGLAGAKMETVGTFSAAAAPWKVGAPLKGLEQIGKQQVKWVEIGANAARELVAEVRGVRGQLRGMTVPAVLA